MDLPADLVRTLVVVTSSAVVNTTTTGTLVASPGGALRLRLWAFQAYPVTTSQAVVNWRVVLNNGAGGSAVGGVSGATFAAPPISWLPGGMALTATNLLEWNVSAALASMALHVLAWTTIETP